MSTQIREATLEAALRAAPDDPAPYAVYSDWLQHHGNPLGEIMALALADKPVPPEELAKLGLPSNELATVGWRWGMWDWLKLENAGGWMDNEFDAPALACTLFDMVPCAALRELRVGVLRSGYNQVDVPAVIAEAARRAWAADLRALRLGDVDETIDMAHCAIGAVGEPITKAFPKLRTLFLHSGEQRWHAHDVPTLGFAGLDLPELESLTIETCAMTAPRLDEVYAAKLPKLERLVLWFGMDEYGATAKLGDLAPLLDGTAFPRVTSLGLCNCEFADELVGVLGRSKVAPRLLRLDLSKGTLADGGADVLASHAAAFRNLVSLDTADNYVTAPALQRLQRAFGTGVEITASAPRRYAGTRYVAVYE
jgi:uncharacterized protein (TIGR02996 family)